MSKLTAVAFALLSKQDPEIAHFTATTSVDNNFLILARVFITGATVAYSAYSVHNAYQEGGTQAALQQLGIEIVTHAVGYGACKLGGKVLFKVGAKLYPSAEAAVASVLKRSPGLKVALGNLTTTIIETAEKLGQSRIGKAITTVEAHVVRGEAYIGEKISQSALGKGIARAEASVANTSKSLGQKVSNKISNLTNPDAIMVTPEGIKISVPATHEEICSFKKSSKTQGSSKGAKSARARKIEAQSSGQITSKDRIIISQEEICKRRIESKGIAKRLGYKETKDYPFDSHAEKVYKNGKNYITFDNTCHKGGFWKVFEGKGRRETYDKYLKKLIGD